MTTARSAPPSSLFVTRFHRVYCLPFLPALFAREARPRYNEMARPTTQRESIRLVTHSNALVSCDASLSSERDKKGPAYTVNQRCTRPSSSARPLETKRLQRLSRKSRSHYSKRDRRSSLILRAAPATRSSSTLEPEPSRRPRAAPATSTPRARETSAPALISTRSGPRQRLFRRRPS